MDQITMDQRFLEQVVCHADRKLAQAATQHLTFQEGSTDIYLEAVTRRAAAKVLSSFTENLTGSEQQLRLLKVTRFSEARV